MAGRKTKKDAALAIEIVDIETLQADPANARDHPDRNLRAITGSLKKFGQRKPIVVGNDGVVQAGSGTLAAARALGWSEVAIVRSPLTGAEAIAYSIADNRTGELSDWNSETLAGLLGSIDKESLELTGFDQNELDQMLARLTPGPKLTPDEEWAASGMPDYQNEDQSSFGRAIVHFACQEDCDAFAELIGQKISGNVTSIWFPYLEPTKVAHQAYVTGE